MADLETQVVVVGGGATGTAVLRDLALRGIDAMLVERADLGTGTSGRWHGLLHSGGRYVVKDPVSATECIEENRKVEYGELVCECELVTRARIEAAVDQGTTELGDLRRQLRLGFGPCQGAFCGWRAAAIVDDRRPGATEPLANLERFLEERWRGPRVAVWGDGAVQALVNHATYRGTFDLRPHQEPAETEREA